MNAVDTRTRDPQHVFAKAFLWAFMLLSTANVLDDFGASRPVSAALGLLAGLLLGVCGVLLLGDWQGLLALLARRRTEGRFWRMAGVPLIARAAGVVLTGGCIFIVVEAVRIFARAT